MKLFENNVGRPSNDTLKKRLYFKVLLGAIIVSTFTALCLIVNTNNIKGSIFDIFKKKSTTTKKVSTTKKTTTTKKVSTTKKTTKKTTTKKDVYYYTISDSILRKEASQTSNIIIVLQKGTRVKYISSETKSYTTDTGEEKKLVYYKVSIDDVKDSTTNKKYYNTNDKGYVLARQLGENKVSRDNSATLTIEQKTKIAKKALEIQQLGFKYPEDDSTRVTGYNYIINKTTTKNKQYYIDCSAFTSALFNSTLNLGLETSDKKPFRVKDFDSSLNDTKKSKFKVLQTVEKENAKIDTSKLQVGDIIYGLVHDDHYNYIHNHIVTYVGDGYIMHSTSSYLNGQKKFENQKKRNGVVHERLETTFYTKLCDKKDCRFNKKIRLIRVK